jgi:hypothetical protein
MSENNPTEFDKIIDKFCADLKKRINNMYYRRQKKIVKETQLANKTSKKPRKEEAKPERTRHGERTSRHKKSSTSTSGSSDTSSGSRSSSV